MYFLVENRGFLLLSYVLPPVHLFFHLSPKMTLLKACSLKALGYLFQDLGKSLGWQHVFFLCKKGSYFQGKPFLLGL